MVQLYLGILLVIVIMFQTGSRLFDETQKRRQLLMDVDERGKLLKQKAGL